MSNVLFRDHIPSQSQQGDLSPGRRYWDVFIDALEPQAILTRLGLSKSQLTAANKAKQCPRLNDQVVWATQLWDRFEAAYKMSPGGCFKARLCVTDLHELQSSDGHLYTTIDC